VSSDREATSGMARRPSAAGSRLGRWLVPALALLLGACVNEEREQAIGDTIAAQINAQVPLVEDPAVNLYVNELGQLLAQHSRRPHVPYRFYVVDADGMNAFALPGGHVYVNRGLIERTRNVSELAGILAHEIAHVSARHGAKNLQRHMRTSSMAGMMWQLILGREPIVDHDAIHVGREIWRAQHSRRDEREADRQAVRYMVAAGVDPKGMLTMFDLLLEEEDRTQDAVSIQWFATHPPTEKRIEATRQHIGKVLPDPSPKLAKNVSSYPLFLERLQRLPPPPLKFFHP
jgi:beta-barrel assembly-enhancing protease